MVAVTTAKIIADSLSPDGIRLTTFQLEYARYVHSEFMTHRVFSRNASSSRAVPVAKTIQNVLDNPVMPMHWMANKPGMQGGELLEELLSQAADSYWLEARDAAVKAAQKLLKVGATGAHKQYVNRLLEPFSTIHVVVTATDFANFFALRLDAGAQPEIQALAHAMWDAYHASEPTTLGYDAWHLPYIEIYDDVELAKAYLAEHQPKLQSSGNVIAALLKMSTARCARVSYLRHDGEDPEVTDDLELYERLIESTPMHASPAEHQGTPDRLRGPDVWARPEMHGNFTGWMQYRQTLKGERSTVMSFGDNQVAIQTSNELRQLGML